MQAELPTYHLPPTSTPNMLFDYVKKGLLNQCFYSLNLVFYDSIILGLGGGVVSSEKIGFVDVVDTREGLLEFGASFLSREDSFEVSRALPGWCLKLEAASC